MLLTTANIHSVTNGLRSCCCQQICLYDIGNIGKIARLLPISKDDGASSFDQCCKKTRNHRRILRSRILPWAEDIKVAKRNSFELINTGEYTTEQLARKLLKSISRHWIRWNILPFRQCWRISV